MSDDNDKQDPPTERARPGTRRTQKWIHKKDDEPSRPRRVKGGRYSRGGPAR